jgi:membrane associated rhomboid family serine protease
MAQILKISNFSFHHSAHLLAVGIIIMSIIQALLTQQGASTFLFSPLAVLGHAHVWKPVTSLFIARNPLEIIFGGLIVYSIGGSLENWWGRKRFLLRALGIPLVAQIIVLIFALFSPSSFAGAVYPGAGQVITALWILFGLSAHFRGQLLNFWGTPLQGNTFALIGLGFVVLGAVFNRIILVLPELITAGLCYALMYRGSFREARRKLELAYYNWKLKRLKSRKGLRLVKGSKGESDDDPKPHIH